MPDTSLACSACRIPLPDDASFCFKCGTATPSDRGAPARAATHAAKEMARIQAALGDRYVVSEALGSGGMATVYRARDKRHQRDVAVKVLQSELAATVEAQRFLQEIEIAAGLNHPHILPMHDSGEADGVLYYVMPLVEGETLEDRLQRSGRLPPDEAVRLAREVAEALQFAHDRGIIHRDIKPGNILIQAGHALVSDFGIARALESVGAALTETGYSVGTPQYMSPEQALGEPDIDGRADIYAVGAVLYEMLTGQVPYRGKTAQAVLANKITSDPLPFDAASLGVPSVLDRVIRRAMARDPADRYQSAEELADTLVLVDMNVLTEGVRTALVAKSETSSAGITAAQRRLAVVAGMSTAATLALIYAAGQWVGLPPWVFLALSALIAIGAPAAYALRTRLRRKRAG